MKKTLTRDLLPSTLRGLPLPQTLNEEKRTVEVVFSVGAAVLRRDWLGEEWYEELSLEPVHCRLGRLNSGAPVLDTHGAKGEPSLKNQIGVVERAWLVPNEGHAELRISDRDEQCKAYWHDIKAGIIRNVSIGYRVFKYLDVTPPDATIPHFRAVDWEIFEVSFLSIPADPHAGVRGGSWKAEACEFFVSSKSAERALNKENVKMKTKKKQIQTELPDDSTRGASEEVEQNDDEDEVETPEQPVAAKRSLDSTKQKAPSVDHTAVERARAAGISKSVEKAGLSSTFARELIENGTSLEQARELIIDEFGKQGGQKVRGATRVEMGDLDETVTRRSGAVEALLHRWNPVAYTFTDKSRSFRGMSLPDMVRTLLSARGENVSGMTPWELSQRAFSSTSDFPNIVADVANKTLRSGYETTQRSFTAFCREAIAKDFKEMNRVLLSGFPSLEKVGQGGEVKRGPMSDSKEKYALVTLAKIFAVSRQAIVNDDVEAFTRLPMLAGRAAADAESDAVWGIINANAALADSVALFHASHGNLAGAGAVPSVTTVGAARSAMRTQKGLEGRPINIEGKFLLAPAALELAVQQLVTRDITPGKAADTNPYKGLLIPVIEPRLDGNSTTAWYLACDPSQCDTIEYAYLEGQRGAYVEVRQGFEVEGMELKVRLDFGAKALDHRGLYKNAGA